MRRWNPIIEWRVCAAGALAVTGALGSSSFGQYTRIASFGIPDEMTALPAKESLILSTIQGIVVSTRVHADFQTVGNYDASRVQVFLIQSSRGTSLIGAALGWSGQGRFIADFDSPDLNGEIDFAGNPLATWIMVRESGLTGGTQIVGIFTNSAFDVEYIPSCPADIDLNGSVGLGDIGAIISSWGMSGTHLIEDLDTSGAIDLGDIAAVIGAWGHVCPCPNCK